MDAIIKQTMLTNNIPGVSISILSDNEIVRNMSYGYAYFRENKMVDSTTAFVLGSISKTFIATALMQLWEKDLFELDNNINDYLPEDIHPSFPDIPISFRHLLSHTSGLDRRDGGLNELTSWDSDSNIPLETSVKDYFLPSGEYYSTAIFNGYAPGTYYEYCNFLCG